jgi:hypothetical protein
MVISEIKVLGSVSGASGPTLPRRHFQEICFKDINLSNLPWNQGRLRKCQCLRQRPEGGLTGDRRDRNLIVRQKLIGTGIAEKTVERLSGGPRL